MKYFVYSLDIWILTLNHFQVIFACLLVSASCRPQAREEEPIAIISQNIGEVDGAYFEHDFEAANGIIQAKSGAEGSAGQSNFVGSYR